MAGADLMAFLSVTRSFKSRLHVTRRFSRHLLDLGVHGRAMQLLNGVALVARLAKSAEKLGVQLIESAPAQRLILENGAVRGAVVATAGGAIEIRAARGAVLAAGGFPNDVPRRKALFPRTPRRAASLRPRWPKRSWHSTRMRDAARIRSSDAARPRTTASRAIRCMHPTRAWHRSSTDRSMRSRCSPAASAHSPD